MTKNAPIFAKKKRSIKGRLLVLCILLIVVFGIVALVSELSKSTKSYLKDIKISEAVVVETASDEDGNYVRLQVNDPSVTLSSDDRWVQVNSSFYRSHKVNSKVGILLGNYDNFVSNHTIFGGKGQSYKNSSWSIDNIYNSLDEAKKANPYKKYTASGIIDKKKTLRNGKKFFELRVDGRTLTKEVSDDIYSKYEVLHNIQCILEGHGEFMKITGFKE